MVAGTIYAEGGGRGKAGKSKLREGFRNFIEQAGLKGKMPGILAFGSREDAFKDFRVALKEGEASEVPLLVVDSEAPVRSNSSPW